MNKCSLIDVIYLVIKAIFCCGLCFLASEKFLVRFSGGFIFICYFCACVPPETKLQTLRQPVILLRLVLCNSQMFVWLLWLFSKAANGVFEDKKKEKELGQLGFLSLPKTLLFFAWIKFNTVRFIPVSWIIQILLRAESVQASRLKEVTWKIPANFDSHKPRTFSRFAWQSFREVHCAAPAPLYEKK